MEQHQEKIPSFLRLSEKGKQFFCPICMSLSISANAGRRVRFLKIWDLICQDYNVVQEQAKGDQSDCNNYRGIFLMSIVGKLFARVVLTRLQVLADCICPESQWDFRSGRPTIDMIFSMRQLQEKCREQRQPLHLALVDLTKAFDLVSCSGLFKLLQKIGCLPAFSIIKSHSIYCMVMISTVTFDGNTPKPSRVNNGVKQGCVLAPALFGILFSLLLTYAFQFCHDAICMYTFTPGMMASSMFWLVSALKPNNQCPSQGDAVWWWCGSR